MRILTTLVVTLALAGAAAAAVPEPFRDVRAELPTRTSDGGYAGRVSWGSRSVEARLAPVGEAWVLAYRLSAGRLSDLVPRLRGTLVDELDLTDPVLVYSLDKASVELPRESARFFGVKKLEIERGVNLLSKVSPRKGSSVRAALDFLGIRIDGLILRGVVLKNFDVASLKQAEEEGELKKALRRGTELRVTLPEFRLRGLPESFECGRAFFFVTGEPGAGVGFGMTTASGHDFDCSLSIRKTSTGAKEVTVTASRKGRWENALDIPGFHLDETTLLLGVDSSQNVKFGLRADMAFGKKRVAIAGSVSFHAVTGVVTGCMFEGETDSLGSADLIALANAIGNGKGKPLSADDLPDFGLTDVKFRYAPMGGDDRLGIESGLALAGRLHAFGRELAAVDGLMDQQTIIPTWKLKGHVADFDLGLVALRDAMVDIEIGPTTNPRFRVKGMSKMWISKKAVDVDIGRKRFHFEVLDRLDGIYLTHYKVTSPAAGRPSWNADARFRNDLTRTLERDVSKAAREWADRAESDFEKAEEDLDAAIANLDRIDAKIVATRAEVESERAAAMADMSRAEADVKRLDALIARRSQQLDAGIAKLKGAASSAKRKRDAAKKAWKKAVAATKRAPIHKKPKYKAIEVKRYKELVEAETALATANASVKTAQARVDPQLRSLQAARTSAVATLKATQVVYQKVTGGVSVDADPRIVGLKTEKVAANAALVVARETVEVTGKAVTGAARITAFAAENNGRLLMVDESRFAGQLARSLKGTKGEIRIRGRWLGEPKELRLRGSLDDVRRGLVNLVWKALKKDL
jgi:tetratricopeptide (TPR) repeat protein